MHPPVLAVDLGGTNMRAAIVAADGSVLARTRRPTPRSETCPDALLALIRDVRDAGARDASDPDGGADARDASDADGGEAEASGADARGTAAPDSGAARDVVIGVPGRIDYREGRLEHAPNLPSSWVPDLAEERLRDAFDLPVALANDGDLAAVGEACFGAGRGHVDVAYVTLSTGVGAGVVSGGRLLRGRRSLAEIGHTVLDRAAAADGRPATVEELGSGTALERLADDVGLEPDGAEVTSAVRAGDRTAREVWDEVVTAAAFGITNLTHLFAPDVVVVGGGMGRNGDLVLDAVRSVLDRHGPVGLADRIVLAEAALGDDAGLVGAAAWHDAVDGAGSTGG